jgi:hypothetical protein
MKLYVDLDGVLADFDRAAQEILDTENHYKYEFIWGPEVYWKKLHAKGDFFAKLKPMSDAGHLWGKINHMNPTILTALPSTEAERVEKQKRTWVQKNLYPQPTEDICCKTTEKPNYCCYPGDILIDDRAVNRDAWMARGGTYIIHTTAERTIGTLNALGII